MLTWNERHGWTWVGDPGRDPYVGYVSVATLDRQRRVSEKESRRVVALLARRRRTERGLIAVAIAALIRRIDLARGACDLADTEEEP